MHKIGGNRDALGGGIGESATMTGGPSADLVVEKFAGKIMNTRGRRGVGDAITKRSEVKNFLPH